MKTILDNDWQNLLEKEFQKDYYQNLRKFLFREYKTGTVYPQPKDIYNALRFTSYKDTKAVILGQDPYHGEGQAHGLSFSVKPGVPQPPSLKNIFKELKDDLGVPIPNHGSLEKWGKEGVLLLNTVLTVRKGEAHSHRNQGWERLTDTIIEHLNDRDNPIVFLLWGRPAQEKGKLVTNPRHYILKAPHPSPLSAYRGFFGKRMFSKTNQILEKEGLGKIDWEIPDL